MTFDELWTQVAEMKRFPKMAIDQIPVTLSDETKMKLTEIDPPSAMEVIQDAIDEVDQGSVRSLNELIVERL